jgi:lactate dehydrogenase-like 2-hydroxyacid dehydrogenase
VTHRVLIIDPQFDGHPEIEAAVMGDGTVFEIARPDAAGHVFAAPFETADAVVNCRSRHRIPASLVARLDRARVVVQAGVGFNHIDLEACAARGIAVCNTPDYGTREVADHAIGLMLALLRGIPTHDARLRLEPGSWTTEALRLRPVRRLSSLTFGVVGLGRIGMAAALRARAFGMAVAFHDPHQAPGVELALGFTRAASLHALLGMADVVSLHCPLSPSTDRLMNDSAFAAMRPDAVLLNTSRGGVVDLDALDRALRHGTLAAAGLDVLPTEPPDRSHKLLADWAARAPWLEGRLVVTPHAAFYSPESVADMRRLSMQAVADCLLHGTLRCCVNLGMLRRHGHHQGEAP